MNALDICNSAISKVGGKVLRSFSDDTPERDIVVRQYPFICDMMLRGHVWSFAKHIVTLAPITTTLPEPWTYAFQLPSDCARTLSLDVEYFEKAGAIVYADTDALTVRYVRNRETTLGSVDYPSDFGEAFACYLASEITMKLTQDPGLRNSLLTLHGDLIRSARFNGAVEAPPMAVIADSWLVDRQVGDYTDVGVRDLNAPAAGL